MLIYIVLFQFIILNTRLILDPAIIGRDGIEEEIELKLTSEEKEKLQAAADKIKEHLKQLKK